MKTLLYANRAESKSISVISILLLAAVGDITKLRCMHRECYIFASQNLWYYYEKKLVSPEYSFPARAVVNSMISKFKYNSDDNIITNNDLQYLTPLYA